MLKMQINETVFLHKCLQSPGSAAPPHPPGHFGWCLCKLSFHRRNQPQIQNWTTTAMVHAVETIPNIVNVIPFVFTGLRFPSHVSSVIFSVK